MEKWQHYIDRFNRKLRFWTLLIAVPLILIICFNIFDRQKELTNISSDSELLNLLESVGQSLHYIQRERGLATAFSARDTHEHFVEIEASRQDTNKRINHLEELINNYSRYSSAGFNSVLKKINVELKKLPDIRAIVTNRQLPARQIFLAYSDLNSRLFRAVEQINFYTNTPRLAKKITGYIIFLRYMELLGQDRAIRTQIYSENGVDLALYRRYIALDVKINNYRTLFLSLNEPHIVERYNELRHTNKITDDAEKSSNLTEVALLKSYHDIDAEKWWRTQTNYIDQHLELERFIVLSELNKLQQQEESLTIELKISYVILFVSLLIIVFILVCVEKNEKRTHENNSNSKFIVSNIQLVSISIILVFCMGGLAYSSIIDVRNKLKSQVVDMLIAMVTEADEDLSNETLRMTLSVAEEWASNDNVIHNIKSLLLTQNKSKDLKGHEAQSNLRNFFANRLRKLQGEGVFIVSPTYTNLMSMRDANLGKINLVRKIRPEILDIAFLGKPSFIPPVVSDVPLKNELGLLVEGYPTMFIATPVIDKKGEIIAVLMIRLDPNKGFSKIISSKRTWTSAKTYGFDDQGRILTNSKLSIQLQEDKLLKVAEEQYLNEVRVPKELSSGESPYTQMAQRALLGQNGSTVKAYIDYTGALVLGAWLWNPDLNIGIATEVEKNEIISSIASVTRTVVLEFLLAVILVTATIFTIYRVQRKTTNEIFKSLELSNNEKKRAEGALTKLQKVEAKLNAIVQTAKDGIVVTDSKGNIQSMNPAVADLFGYPFKSLIGKSISLLIPKPEYETHANYIGLIKDTDKKNLSCTEQEMLARRSDGSFFPIELSVNQLELDSGIQFAGIIRDISERKKNDNELIQAREEAEQADLAKSIFLANMSHEIRTPLNGIVGTIDMLNYTNLEKTQYDLINTARDSAKMLSTIIDDILDFSKIEAGKLEIEQVPVCLCSLMEDVSDSLRTIASEKSVELLTYCDPNLPMVKGDPVRLKQILFNLLGNAVKFTGNITERSGRVMLEVLFSSQVEGIVRFCFKVTDNGIGMSEQVKNRLFKSFMQGEGNITRRFGGTGLGLVITQRLIELMDGSINVKSKEGKGSIFSVLLQLEINEKLSPPRYSDLNELPILLINSDNEIYRIMDKYLSYSGAEVIQATTENVIQLFHDVNKDTEEVIIVFDTLGDEEQFSNLRNKICQSTNNSNARFITIERGNNRYARYNFDDGLILNINALRKTTVLNAVATLAGRESPELSEQTLDHIVTADFNYTVDEAREAGTLILIADDNKTNQKVIKQQLNMLGYASEVADDGKQALSMWKKDRYGLLMTDCHMPVMDGYQLASIIRSQEKEHKRMPIIAITADAMKGTAEKCFSSGMDGYLTKPMELHQIKTTLQKWLKQKEFAIERTETALPTKTQHAEHVSTFVEAATLSAMLGTNDPSILLDFYIDYQQSANDIHDKLQSAYSNQNFLKVSQLAHNLKSIAKVIGANPLSECCNTIELAFHENDVTTVEECINDFTVLFQQTENWIEEYKKAQKNSHDFVH